MSRPKVNMSPAQFAEYFYNLNFTRPFRFKGREYFIPIYNSNATTELFKTGRQCAKSTFLCHRMLTRAATDSLQILYEAPKKEQSITFSRQKIDPTIFSSPKFARFLKLNSKGIVEDKNILNFYCFKTGSYIKLSTTFNGVDRDRGLSIDDLYIDEVQDQNKEDIHVLQEALSASTKDQYMAYAGTPKSRGNYIEQLWQESKQFHWLMKCTCCNEWQLPTMEHNIREAGLLCKKCEKRLDVMNGQWVMGNSAGKYNGWHVSQLMRLVNDMPGRLKWTTQEGIHGIYDKYKRYSPAKFVNEVLGESFDSAEHPLTYTDMQLASFPFLKMQTKYEPTFFSEPIVMGIDWGRNQSNYTVVSVCIEYQGRPTIVYLRRFEGTEAEPSVTAEIIKDIYIKFKCNVIFADKGLYVWYKSSLENKFGPEFVKKKINLIDYRMNDEKMIVRSKNPMENRYLVSRNEVMNLFTNSIKQKKVGFFNMEEMMKGNFVNDFTSIGYEVRDSKDRGDRLFFLSSGDGGSPTDAFQSSLYSWLGLMMINKRLKWYYNMEKKVHDINY